MGKARHQAININSRVDAIDKPWVPECLLTMNNSHSIKIGQFKGDFIWHSMDRTLTSREHDNTDELFYCVSGGPFKIELSTSASSPEEAEKLGADEVVEMKVGDVFCVPRDMQHRPVADVEAGVVMIEKVGTINTGGRKDTKMTVHVDEDGK